MSHSSCSLPPSLAPTVLPTRSTSQLRSYTLHRSTPPNEPHADPTQYIHRITHTLRLFYTRHSSSLRWRVPLFLLLLLLLRRRLQRTRAELFSARSKWFFQTSIQPPHTAYADHLPALTVTHLIYSLLPLSFQHAARDSGIFRYLADLGAVIGGAILFGWRPRIMHRMFGKRHGQLIGIPYGSHSRQVLDIFSTHRVNSSNPPPSSTLSPILLVIHGGAWGSGVKEIYRLLCQQFDEQLHFVTIIPNYRYYPQATTEGQIADVEMALEWVYQHGSTYGGDVQRIYVLGHSSGAHISSMVMLRQVTSGLSCRMHGLIGLSGPYDIDEHYEFEAARGVMEISPMKASNGGEEGMTKYSALHLALSLTHAQRANLPAILLLHGASDTTVPYGASVRMAYALTGDMKNEAAIPLAPLDCHDRYHANPPSIITDDLRSSRAITFPLTHCSVPLIHLRICGSAEDPAQCDHASFIFDIMNTHTRRTQDGKECVTVGHTEWIVESIDTFRKAADRRDKQIVSFMPTTSKPTKHIVSHL